MRRVLAAAAVTVPLACCGCGAGSGDHAGRHREAKVFTTASPARLTLNSFSLPHVGVVAAACPVPGPFRMRFTVDRRTATTRVKVRLGTGPATVRSVDPGKTLALDVPVKKRQVGPDLVYQTPRIVWRMEQATQAHTIRAVARAVLRNGDEGGARSCVFHRLGTKLTTRSSSEG